MSILAIFPDNGDEPAEIIKDHSKISKILDGIGVLFEPWDTSIIVTDAASQEEILKAYHVQVEQLKERYKFQSADVVSLQKDHPDREAMRQKFLAEHTHTDDEIRFFVEGSGLFYLHVENIVYAVLCQKGDLISVPANIAHWFDMGSKPLFKCIRLFTDPVGWVGHPTGSNISSLLPDYDAFVDEF